MKVKVGIDTGLTTTAIVALSDNKVVYSYDFGKAAKFRKVVHSPLSLRYKLYGIEFKKAISEILNLADVQDISIAIEIPMGNFMGNSVRVAELFGYYLSILDSLGIQPEQINIMSPTYIKKKFTGIGNSGKIDIINECSDRGFNAPNEHQADAYAMASLL